MVPPQSCLGALDDPAGFCNIAKRLPFIHVKAYIVRAWRTRAPQTLVGEDQDAHYLSSAGMNAEKVLQGKHYTRHISFVWSCSFSRTPGMQLKSTVIRGVAYLVLFLFLVGINIVRTSGRSSSSAWKYRSLSSSSF